MERIGPQLPPGFSKETSSPNEDDSEDDFYGPSLPPTTCSDKSTRPDNEREKTTIGPCLPPSLTSRANKNISSHATSTSRNYIGPALPPELAEKFGPEAPSCKAEQDSCNIGPTLPDKKELIAKINDNDEDLYGPALPPNLQTNSDSDSDSDGGVIGPMPSTGNEQYSAAEEFEKRARLMKCKLAGEAESKAPVRESWMTELPSSKASAQLGLQARNFRSKAAPELDKAWTETPADREKKQKETKNSNSKAADYHSSRLKERDEEIAAQVDQYNKSKRKESLLDMHQKTRKAKKEQEDDGQPPKRRAFDREVDLQVNRFDDAQRRSVIKKSQQLDTRFGHGSSKFI